MSVRKTFLLVLLLVSAFHLFSQKENPLKGEPFGKRLVFGGNLGLSFGTVTYIEASPTVGYKITDRWISGVGVTYIYWKAEDFSSSIYGGSLFTQYLVANNFLVQAEYQVVNLDCSYFNVLERKNVPHLWVGGGYHSGRGQGLGFGITALYDLIQDPCSPFQNPNIRVGVNYGF